MRAIAGYLWLGALLAIAAVCAGCRAKPQAPLDILVTDPIAEQFACDCVSPSMMHSYGRLAGFLQERMGRPVRVVYAEDLAAGKADLVIGKRSVLLHQAGKLGMRLRALGALTDAEGDAHVTGVFIVRADDPAASIADLNGRRILIGTEGTDEKHDAALAALRDAGVEVNEPLATIGRCTAAELAVYEKRTDAAVISSYAAACLDESTFAPRGSLKIIGRTAPVPFITVFATDELAGADGAAVSAALFGLRQRPELLRDLKSRDGFVAPQTSR